MYELLFLLLSILPFFCLSPTGPGLPDSSARHRIRSDTLPGCPRSGWRSLWNCLSAAPWRCLCSQKGEREGQFLLNMIKIYEMCGCAYANEGSTGEAAACRVAFTSTAPLLLLCDYFAVGLLPSCHILAWFYVLQKYWYLCASKWLKEWIPSLGICSPQDLMIMYPDVVCSELLTPTSGHCLHCVCKQRTYSANSQGGENNCIALLI